MSNRRHFDAALEGYDGPFFPESAWDLQRLLDSAAINGAELEAIGRTVDGFVTKDRPTTSDGYTWFWSLEFSAGNATVIIMIPWYQDWNRSGNTQGDRSIAVHTRNAAEAHPELLVRHLLEAIPPYIRTRVRGRSEYAKA